MRYDSKEVHAFLHEVKDPELPSLDIVELGIVRDVEVTPQRVVVRITPTYSGCPALDVIREGIVEVLTRKGIDNVRVEKVLSPAWSSDWLSDSARDKLKAAGIAPPRSQKEMSEQLVSLPKRLPCPRCNSTKTELRTEFSSTACKALWYCNDCEEPFEHFKEF